MDLLQNNQHKASLINKFGIEKISTFLLVSYVFVMPFTSAFSITSTISFSLIFSLILLLVSVFYFLIYQARAKQFWGLDFILVVLFLFTVVFSYYISGRENPKSLNHTIAYLSTFILFFFTIKYVLFNSTKKDYLVLCLLKTISYTTILSSLFACIEFVLGNFYSININDYVPRPVESEELYDATAIELFIRARSFAVESGHFAFMIELFGPLTIYYLYASSLCKWSLLIKFFVTLIIILGVIASFSSAAFVIIPIAIFISTVIRFKYFYARVKQLLLKQIAFIIGCSIALLSAFFYFLPLGLLVINVTDKLGSNSYDDRQDRINFFFNEFNRLPLINKIIGAGPCGFGNLGFDDSKSILSLYYSITFETGYLGLLIFFLFIGFCFLKIIRIKSIIGFYLLVSFLSGLFHYWFISNYWYPWFWFVLAFALFYQQYSTEINEKNNTHHSNF